MDQPSFGRLFQFSRELQRAMTFSDMLALVRDEIEAVIGYRHAWLCIFEPDLKSARILGTSSEHERAIWEHAAVIPVEGDAMMAEIITRERPVIVEDAFTDPRTNKEIVAQLRNRTIINVPLQVIGTPFGAVGTGTFGDEGCRLPTEAQLDYLMAMSSHLSVAASRVRWLEEQASAQREREKLQQRLFVSQKLESLGLLAGGIAHDFNNLLTVIGGYSELALQSMRAEDPAFEPLHEITRAAERAAGLTSQLLAFGRRQARAPKALDLNSVMPTLTRLLERLIGEDISLEFQPGSPLGNVFADPSQIEQVIINLVLNARDAMPGGGRLILSTAEVALDDTLVRAHPPAQPGPYIYLAVQDTGTGMSSEVFAHLFEPFFTTKAPGRGTGLGLATVYGIASQQGGFVDIETSLGQGTTVRVYFPRHEHAEAPARPLDAEPAAGLGWETILVAEDDAAIRRLVQETLRRQGYQVLVAEHGVAAKRLADEYAGAIHLLLADVVMPELSGPDLVQQLRSARLDLKVLYITGYPYLRSAAQGSSVDSEATLPKPFTPSELLARVRTILDQ